MGGGARHAGEAALIQRCQVHKRRNVVDTAKNISRRSEKLQNVRMTEYADAKRALERLHRELMELNPSAARSPSKAAKEVKCFHSSCVRFGT